MVNGWSEELRATQKATEPHPVRIIKGRKYRIPAQQVRLASRLIFTDEQSTAGGRLALP